MLQGDALWLGVSTLACPERLPWQASEGLDTNGGLASEAARQIKLRREEDLPSRIALRAFATELASLIGFGERLRTGFQLGRVAVGIFFTPSISGHIGSVAVRAGGQH